MLTMEKILFLKTVTLFSSLKMNELATIAEISEEILLKKDKILFLENEIGDSLYLIIKGKVKVYKTLGNKEVIIAILGEKECVGEMSMLVNETRSATVSAAEDTELLRITSEDFRELVYDYPDIAFGMFKVFTKRIRENQPDHDDLIVSPATHSQ